jgi:hypothetical protein
MINSPKIQSIVQDFIARLSDALSDEGAAAIRAALGGPAGGALRAGKRGPGRPPGSGKAKPGPKPKGRAKGAKRSPEELENQTKTLAAHIKKNGGQRIEAISKAIGVSTKDLALPIQKLLADKAISKKGNRRATAYFPR